IKMYSDRGYNVIVDGVLDDESWMDIFVEILHDNPVLFVHVTCPAAELTRRELARGDREIGLAVEQLDYLCPKEPFYDITVDTHANTTQACADKIIAQLDMPDSFQAFKALQITKGA
ncbi:MAG: chloramphenicol phosphotransferase CPT family protein, partial [Defluviitaleaceae bacterium]|nr:chloramphenicol phosphotransferase CPT family protein [Defluviitaleaceae bacterium]